MEGLPRRQQSSGQQRLISFVMTVSGFIILSAITYYGNVQMVISRNADHCEWIVADAATIPTISEVWDKELWEQVGSVTRPTDKNDQLVVLRKRKP